MKTTALTSTTVTNSITSNYNPLESKVSLFDTIKHTSNGIGIELKTILDSIKNGEWKSDIIKLRNLDPQHQANFKKGLANFTASGLFGSRDDDSLIQHSNIIVLDLDKLTDVPSTKELVTKDKYTQFAFTSCRGNGLAVGVIIDGKFHRESFNQLKDYYQNQLGLTVDESCINVSRTRFVSYDTDLYINESSEPFILAAEVNAPAISRAASSTFTPILATDNSDEAKYQNCKSIINKNKSYVDGERHQYLFTLAGFCNKAGVSGAYTMNQMVTDFSVASKTSTEIESIIKHCYDRTHEHNTIQLNEFIEVPKIDGNEDIKAIYAFAHKLNRDGGKWEDKDVTFQSDKYKIAPDVVRNIFEFIFKNNADENGINKKPAIYQVEHFLNKTYDLRQNVVTQSPEFKRKTEKHYQILNEDSIYRSLMHANIKYPLNQLSSLLKSDFLKEYNPFKMFFEQLPAWDGNTDHIDKLAGYVQTENQKFFNIQFKKMLVRSIGCSVYGKANRFVFVLVSEQQEMGKSWFIRSLNPFKEKYYTEAPLRDNKDSEFRTSENFIYNLEELSSLKNVEVNSLKAIISKVAVKERRAYAKQEIEAPRRCNFWGSTNKEEFLTDTVNTRWLCFTIDNINWDYTKDIDINQVWAQAYALYKAGFDAELTKEERIFREEANKGYELRGDEADWISKYFKVVKSTDNDAEFMILVEIEAYIQNMEKRPLQMHRVGLGRTLTQLGFEKGKQRVNGQQTRGYWVGIAARGNQDKTTETGLFNL